MEKAQDDLEIVSVGALYRGHWEKKYWSSSRAKDRYPYPVGYRAIRNHAGTICQMEIREGPKGPLFLVKLADEESCSGLTPDLAWKSFQKKNSPKAVNWNGRRLSSNIDGSELFGFKNKVVQRLLRELVANANSASPNETKEALPVHENLQNQYKSSDKSLVYLRKSKHNGKRSVKCKPEERLAKRMHKEGCTSNNYEMSYLLGGSQKEEIDGEQTDTIKGDCDEKQLISMENHNKTVAEVIPSYVENIKGSITIMNNNPDKDIVQDSFVETDNNLALKPAQPLPEEIYPLVDCTPEDAIMKEELRDSMSDVRPSSGSSNLSSQKTDHDSEQQDIMRSMMAFLLPQAIPLLKKTYRRKSSRRKMRENIAKVGNDLVTKENVGGQVEAGDLNHKPDAKIIGSTLLDVRQSTGLSLSECNLGSLDAAEEEKDVIPDTCEDYNTVNKTDCKTIDAFRPTFITKEDVKLNCKLDGEAVFCTLLDVETMNLPHSECKHEPLRTSEDAKDVIPDSLNENITAKEAGHVSDASGPSSIKKADDKSQKDLEKAGILLSDSFLACLEEEFVKIETERIQNCIKNENPLSESITCQNFENMAILENKVTDLPLENKLETLCGPYLHPQPVLSVTLNSKGDSIELCVLCGALDSCERALYVYHVTSQAQPLFVGYASLLFLSSEEPPVKGNLTLGRVGLQYITEEQLLVLFPSIKAPFCSNMSIDCPCLNCKLEQGDKNCLRIVHVNFGFVSLVTKLMSQERATCILVCKPNYIIVFEESARLHVWVMSPKWSGVSDEFTVPSSSFDNTGPSILELKEIPGSNCLVLGHNGFGVFFLWDIKRRAHLSVFLAPNIFILEILPLSCFNAHNSELSNSNYSQAHLKDVVAGKRDWQSGDGDMAVWLLVSSATVSEFQKDLKATEPNRRWKLALLAKNSLFLSPVLDQRISVLDASTHYGFAGTLDGIFYKWELISGRKVASIHCSESGSVSCIAVDHQSGAVAVADDRNQVLIYML